MRWIASLHRCCKRGSGKRPARVEVIDEAAIPARFWVASDPKLDKRALGDALKAGDAVEGAALVTPAPSLTIRSA